MKAFVIVLAELLVDDDTGVVDARRLRWSGSLNLVIANQVGWGVSAHLTEEMTFATAD